MRGVSFGWLAVVMFLLGCCGWQVLNASAPPASAPPYRAVLNAEEAVLEVWNGEMKVYSYDVVCAAPPPAGEFLLAAKSADHSGPGGVYTLELNVGWDSVTMGQAGTDCTVALALSDLEELYRVLPLGASVTVVSTAAPEPAVNAGEGDAGPGIVTLQQALNESGCWCGRADGRFDPLTKAALCRYQALNFKFVSGRLDAATFSSLFRN